MSMEWGGRDSNVGLVDVLGILSSLTPHLLKNIVQALITSLMKIF